ncbi:MAG: hypothetical protein ACRBBS_16920 [Thalassovita sp.]
MKIILHAGAHATDEDRLIKCLLKNAGDLKARNVAVPGPSRYRMLIRDTLNAMAQGQLAEDGRDILLDAILQSDPPDRLILSNESFFATPKNTIARGQIYPGAETKLERFCTLFQQDEVELYLGLRNPAGFLTHMHDKSPDMPFETFLAGSQPTELHWSELIMRIRDKLPDLPITLWANEDTPLLWGHILRQMMGLPGDEKILGGFDLITELMTADGMRRFRAYLKAHPVMSEDQKLRVVSAFLAKFARPEMLEEEVGAPDWSAQEADQMALQYERDVAKLANVPGVRVLMP